MATIKHISSKNADYGAAEKYLTFAHDEFSMKPTLDSIGRLIPREDYRMETVNCVKEDFALSCIRANLRYGKNSRREDVKSHHYIISFDPCDNLKALEQRISGNKELMGQMAAYRKTKPIYDGLKQAKRPEQYREQHRPDLARHEAAVQYFKQQGLKKLPATAKLQGENEALISEKNSLYSQYRAEKARTAELQKVKSNLDTLLRSERQPQKQADMDR